MYTPKYIGLAMEPRGKREGTPLSNKSKNAVRILVHQFIRTTAPPGQLFKKCHASGIEFIGSFTPTSTPDCFTSTN